jgi:hypothetical protein
MEIRKKKLVTAAPCNCFVNPKRTFITNSGHSPKCYFNERYIKEMGFAVGTRN